MAVVMEAANFTDSSRKNTNEEVIAISNLKR